MIYGSVLPFSFKEVSSAAASLLSHGGRLDAFEKKLEEYFGVHAIAVDSGLTAIRVALKAAGLRKGDEIALPAYLCERVGRGLLQEGYSLRFIDVERDYNISVEDFIKKSSGRTRAVIAVHSYGIPCRIDEIAGYAGNLNMLVIDDSAQSFGGRLSGRLLGTFGDAGILSFGWIKPLTAMGGGALLVKDKKLREKARATIRNRKDFRVQLIKLFKSLCYLNKPLYYRVAVDLYGIKGRGAAEDNPAPCVMENKEIVSDFQILQSAIGLVQMERIDSFNKKRLYNSRYLKERLAHLPVVLPEVHEDAPLLRMPVRFPGFSRERTMALSTRYREMGVDAPALYPSLPDLFNIEAGCPNAKLLSDQTLNLPVHPCLDEDDLKRVVEATEKLCKN